MVYDNPSSKRSREASDSENSHTKQGQGSARQRALLFRPLKDTETSSKLDHDPLQKTRYDILLGNDKLKEKISSGSDDEEAGTLWYNPKAEVYQNYEVLHNKQQGPQDAGSSHQAEALSRYEQHDRARYKRQRLDDGERFLLSDSPDEHQQAGSSHQAEALSQHEQHDHQAEALSQHGQHDQARYKRQRLDDGERFLLSDSPDEHQQAGSSHQTEALSRYGQHDQNGHQRRDEQQDSIRLEEQYQQEFLRIETEYPTLEAKLQAFVEDHVKKPGKDAKSSIRRYMRNNGITKSDRDMVLKQQYYKNLGSSDRERAFGVLRKITRYQEDIENDNEKQEFLRIETEYPTLEAKLQAFVEDYVKKHGKGINSSIRRYMQINRITKNDRKMVYKQQYYKNLEINNRKIVLDALRRITKY